MVDTRKTRSQLSSPARRRHQRRVGAWAEDRAGAGAGTADCGTRSVTSRPVVTDARAARMEAHAKTGNVPRTQRP